MALIPAPYIIPPSRVHTHTAILLHGRDSTGPEFASQLFESQASDTRTLLQIFPNTKWVFPHAPLLRSERLGLEMSQWFDMYSTEAPHENEEGQRGGLTRIARYVGNIVRREAAIVGPKKVVLGGISQGGATAIWALVCCGLRINAFIGLSTWLPFRSSFPNIHTPDDETPEGSVVDITGLIHIGRGIGDSSRVVDTPAFIGHCENDEVINVRYGEEMIETLGEHGFGGTFKQYEGGGHWVNEPDGVDDIVAFLRENMDVMAETA